MRICRLMMPLLAVLGAMAVAAPAQAITLKERLVLGAFNMCWQAEDGANLNQLLAQNGFARAPEARRPIYFRMVGGTTVMFTAYFARDTAGEKENACRITALKPQLESPWTPRHAIFDEYQGLLDQLIGGAQKMGSGYRLLARRAPVPGRPGHLRTLLRLDEGSRARIIQVEEGPTFYEFIYFHAARGLADDPANLARIGNPEARAQLQWMVDDSWEVAFCNLNPHNCSTPEQRRQQAEAEARARQARQPIPIPFTGIGRIGSGDNRSPEQRRNDKAWWENYHRCGSGKC